MIERHNGADPDEEGAFVYYDDHLAALDQKIEDIAEMASEYLGHDRCLNEKDEAFIDRIRAMKGDKP